MFVNVGLSGEPRVGVLVSRRPCSCGAGAGCKLARRERVGRSQGGGSTIPARRWPCTHSAPGLASQVP